MSAAQLAEQQRTDQLAVRAAAGHAFLSEVWPVLDPARLDVTVTAYLRLAIDLIRSHRFRSATLGGDYYQAIRATELADARRVRIVRRDLPNTQAVTTSLLVTGPVGVKQRVAAGMPTSEALGRALVESSGAVARHVLDGGRATIAATADDDATCAGWVRVARPGACYFCKLMAIRGVNEHAQAGVYRSEATALRRLDGNAYHDNCSCTARPIFTGRAYEPPRHVLDWAELYRTATRGHHGAAALAAFRRAAT